MNATAIGIPELTCQLLDVAAGIPADAAAGLIISHGHFPVHLRTVLGNLDTRTITLVATATTTANG
jgi:hypothetical protein